MNKYCCVCGFDLSTDEESDVRETRPFNMCKCCLFQFGIR